MKLRTRHGLGLGCLSLTVMAAACAGDPAPSASGASARAAAPEPSLGHAEQASETCLTLQRGVFGVVGDTQIASNIDGAHNPDNIPGDGNFGAGLHMITGMVNIEDPPGQRRTLINFDVSSIPNGSTINSATVTLSAWDGVGTNGTSINVHEVNVPWTEAAVTWNSFAASASPQYAAAPATSQPYSSAATSYTFDVSSLVTAWTSGTANNGMLLEQSGSGNTNFRTSEDASEANRPSLSVCYTPPTVCPGLLVVDNVAHGGFSHPAGVAADSAGNIYVADTGNTRIVEFDSSGNWLRDIGTSVLTYPMGVAVDKNGYVYASQPTGTYCDADSGRTTYAFNPGGTVANTFLNATGYALRLAASPDGTLWEADPFYIGAGCGPGYIAQDTNTNGMGSFSQQTFDYHYGVSGPSAITVDSSATVYYSDATKIYTFLGQWIFPASNPSLAFSDLNGINDISADQLGNVWVAEGHTHNVVKLALPAGTETCSFGSQGSGPGQFQAPTGIAASGACAWVTDSTNNTLTRNSCP